MTAFLAIFFEYFTHLRWNKVHLAGESYGVSPFLFQAHKKLPNLATHGSTFQGRYLPVFASDIYDNNAKLVEAGMPSINLVSLMMGMPILPLRTPSTSTALTSSCLGNPCTDMLTMYSFYYEVQCQHKTFPPVTDIRSVHSPLSYDSVNV